MKQIVNNEKIGKNSKKEIIKTTGVILVGVVPFIFIVYLLLTKIYEIVYNDLQSEKMYIISEKLFIRSDKVKNSYIIGRYNYGTEVNVYNEFGGWAEVSVDSIKGFMALEYLVTPQSFYLINGMFGNDIAKLNITKTIFKKAIAEYFEENNYISEIPKKIKNKFFSGSNEQEIWQIYGVEGEVKYNAIIYGDFNGDKEDDIAFVLRNKKTEKTKLVILSVNTVSSRKYGKLLFSEDLEQEWFFLKKAYKSNKYLINEEKQNIIVDGILIGSNRDKTLNDGVKLLLYDGNKFNFFKQ